MNEQKLTHIDVSELTIKEARELLGIEYTPWYKDSLFWSLCFLFSMPTIVSLVNVFLGE